MESCVSARRKKGEFWHDYMERVMNMRTGKDHNVEEDATVEGPVVCVCREEVTQALNEMRTGGAPGPLNVSLELITVSEQV